MNNKGFTLVELLAVLIILTVIMGVAIPSISSSLERTKVKQNKAKEEMLLSYAEEYVTDHKNEVYRNNDQCFIITIDLLRNYLPNGEMKNADGADIGGYVLFMKPNKYKYKSGNPTANSGDDGQCIILDHDMEEEEQDDGEEPIVEQIRLIDYTFDGSKTIDQINSEGLITITGTSSNSNYNWVIDSTNHYLKSGNYHVNSSTATTTINFVARYSGTLNIGWGVSSESKYDKLTIKINNGSSDTTLVNAQSGTKTGTATHSIESGTTYTVTLSYTKDSSQHKNLDIGYITNFKVVQS